MTGTRRGEPGRLSGKRAALIAALQSAPERGWRPVEDRGLRMLWSRELPTPDYARGTGNGYTTFRPLWDEDTYRQRVFVGLPHPRSAPLVRVDRAPWVEARDLEVTLAGALEILADPGGYLDRDGSRR